MHHQDEKQDNRLISIMTNNMTNLSNKKLGYRIQECSYPHCKSGMSSI